jgi:nucleoside-diphosphate-sugar epimerase
MTKNVVILGSSGFLGTSLLKRMNAKKFRIRTLIHKNNIPSKFNSKSGSILSKSDLDDLIHDNDIVVNLTGSLSTNLQNFFQVNLNGNLNLLNIIKNKKNVKLIVISSVTVYGENDNSSKETDLPNPTSIYGTTKFLTEQICEKFSKNNNLDVTILRVSNLYGPNKRDGIIANLLKSSRSKTPLLLNHNGAQIRDFLFVDDAADGIIQTIQYVKSGFNIFNISSGKKFKIIDVIKEMKKNNIVLNYKLTSSQPDVFCSYSDNSKSKKLLRFNPKINFKKGLHDTIFTN